MSGKSVSEDKKIKKSNIYKNKKILKIDHIDSNKVLVSKEEPYDKKRFIQIFNWIRWWWCYLTIMHKASTNDWVC